MRDSLQRLYETKLAFLATVFTLLGAGLLVLGHLDSQVEALSWLRSLPVTDLGSALFTTGLIAVVFEYLDSKDSEQRATVRLRRVLEEQAPAMRDAVIAGFAFDASDLKRVSSPEVLDRVTRNSLAIQLGDQPFADAVYENLKAQALRAGERWHDLRVTIDLSPWNGRGRKGSTPLYVATMRWEYSVVPSTNVRRFACVEGGREYRDLLQEPASTFAWRFTPVNGLRADQPEAFELVQFSVDGDERPIRRTAREGSQLYSVSIGKAAVEANARVRLSYTYRTLLRSDGHLLYFSLSQPTEDARIDLRYGDTNITAVRVLDFFGGSKTSVLRAPETLPEPSVAVELDGWALPGSGLAFVWDESK
ncbi:hypothetical protein WIS52_14945 [Pseudonocardia nematodicida]|uniref:SMODS-associating 2TM beta-strand rich effector domain-containing protein n=1 Tax=Pseudonocardia nematodicida TaxID=1206997 RepID=A0ABV1KBW4_9PSEU